MLVGCVLVLSACARPNAAYEDGDASSTAGDGTKAEGTGTTSADGTGTTSADGGGTLSGGGTTRTSHTSETTTGPSDEGTTSSDGPGSTTEGAEPTTGPAPSECCSPVVPCANDDIVACACEADSDCCEGPWGVYCVAVANNEGCTTCEPPPFLDCCEAHPAPGCSDFGVVACVCDSMPDCCTLGWGPGCVEAAAGCPESRCA